MLNRLIEKFGVNQPIFTWEILSAMSDYSRPRVFQLLKKAENEGKIIKFEKGVYYIPTETRYGKSLISVEQVVEKKYISNKSDVFGIYAGLHLQHSFRLTYQVPSALEIVSNNETMWVREVKFRDRTIVLRKSRVPITKDNVHAYIILELFNNIDLKKFFEDELIKKEVIEFVKKSGINCKDLYSLAGAFPSKATKNITESGIINELT